MNDPIQEMTIEAERRVVAGVLLDPSVIDSTNEIVSGSQFDNPVLGQALDHITDLHAAGLRIGDTTVMLSELRKVGLIEKLGGAAAVGQMMQSVPGGGSVPYHASEVSRLHRLRKLRALATTIAEDAGDPNADPSEIAAKIDSGASMAFSHETVSTLTEIVSGLADTMDHQRETGITRGVATGISSIDLMTGGYLPGELVVIGARTSIGKTAFGMQVALDAAVEGKSVLVISLEMAEQQLAQRIVASQLGLSLVDQRSGNHSSQDSRRIRDYAKKVSNTPFAVFAARRAKMKRIRGIARARKATHGLDLLVVDYLQLVSPSDPRRQRYEQVTEISGDLKTLAMELEVPVVALAQLNRQGETNEPPKLSHLRESGAIEQDADAVWFLHRGRDSSDTKLIIEKQRQGKRGTLDLSFDGARCRFDEPAIEDHPGYEPEFEEWSACSSPP